MNKLLKVFIVFLVMIGIGVIYYFVIWDDFDRRLLGCSGLDGKSNIIGAEYSCRIKIAREVAVKDTDRAMKICLDATPGGVSSAYYEAMNKGSCKMQLSINANTEDSSNVEGQNKIYRVQKSDLPMTTVLDKTPSVSGEAYLGLDAKKSPIKVVFFDCLQCFTPVIEIMNKLQLRFKNNLALYYVISEPEYFNVGDRLECVGQQALFGYALVSLNKSFKSGGSFISSRDLDLEKFDSEILKIPGLDKDKYDQCLVNPATRAVVVANHTAVKDLGKLYPNIVVENLLYVPTTNMLTVDSVKEVIDYVLGN